MKKITAISVFFALLMLSCSRGDNNKTGVWKPVSVKIGFDEYKSTPDMVRQVGLEEKSNVIAINSDSTFCYVSCGDSIAGKVKNDNSLCADGKVIAVIQNDTIVENKKTVLGDVLIKYVKYK